MRNSYFQAAVDRAPYFDCLENIRKYYKTCLNLLKEKEAFGEKGDLTLELESMA